MRLHTLNLDFCTALTNLQQDCFSCMPNLLCLSMCETRITNLWTTSAALSKLPSLKELRFQNCLCCKDTGPCPSSGEKTSFCGIESQSSLCSYRAEQSADSGDATFHSLNTGKTFRDLLCLDDSQSTTENNRKVEIDLWELSKFLPDMDGSKDFQDEVRK